MGPVKLTVPLSVPLPDDINPVATPDLWSELVAIFGNDISGMYNRVISKNTGDNGCAVFRALVPNIRGDLAPYEVSESLSQSPGWGNTTTDKVEFDVRSVLTYVNSLPVIDGEVVEFKQGRLIIFDSRIPHYAKGPDKGVRFSLGLVLPHHGAQFR